MHRFHRHPFWHRFIFMLPNSVGPRWIGRKVRQCVGTIGFPSSSLESVTLHCIKYEWSPACTVVGKKRWSVGAIHLECYKRPASKGIGLALQSSFPLLLSLLTMADNSTIIEIDIDIEEVHSYYGYIPNKGAGIAFMVLFGLSALLHMGQAIKWRTWYMIPTMALGCIGEVIGWYARYWSSHSPGLLNPFLIQTVCTVISPSFMSAANFTILGLIIARLGPQYSWLSPRWYLIIFIGFDVASLVIQSVGGAKASTAVKNHQSAEPGGRIMLYGIIIQMIALTIYVVLGAEFVRRYHADKPVRAVPPPAGHSSETVDEKRNYNHGPAPVEKNVRIMLIGLIINAVFFFVRTIYRTIELSEGWEGPIITNEKLFIILDGVQIVLCTYTFNLFHPGILLREKTASGSRA